MRAIPSRMDWKAEAERIVEEKIREINFFLNEGMDKERAIEIAMNSCCVGPAYVQKILSTFE